MTRHFKVIISATSRTTGSGCLFRTEKKIKTRSVRSFKYMFQSSVIVVVVSIHHIKKNKIRLTGAQRALKIVEPAAKVPKHATS
jgi:hypothetical protein